MKIHFTMIRFISILLIVISCSDGSIAEYNSVAKPLCNDSLTATSSIKVQYLLQPMPPPMDSLHSKKVLLLTGTLMNVSTDTLCYLTLSCDGTQSLVVYDTNVLRHYQFINICEAVFVQKDTLLPKSSKTFEGQFLVLKDTSHLRLGFALFSVPKDYVINNKEFIDLYHTRNRSNIICSEATWL